jgi:phospholipid transport system substrate-binding protein
MGEGRVVALVIIGMFLLGRAWGGPQEVPTERVRSVLEQAMDIQSRPDLQGEAGRPQRAKLIRQLISENFLSREMAQESLGDRWESLKSEQKEEFRELFVDLFQDSYTRMVLNFLRRETVDYLGEALENGRMRVRTKILRTNEHIPVDYTLLRKDNGWFMVDVIIDGVSIVRNYQTKFRQVILSQSFDYLIKQMRLQSKAIKDSPT